MLFVAYCDGTCISPVYDAMWLYKQPGEAVSCSVGVRSVLVRYSIMFLDIMAISILCHIFYTVSNVWVVLSGVYNPRVLLGCDVSFCCPLQGTTL
jgi:hypothetical protein